MSEFRVNNLSNESNSGGPTISGITTFSGTNYFIPPKGSTKERPENPQPGSVRFNTDTKHLEYFRADSIGWVDVEASHGLLDGGHRGLFNGGYKASPANEQNNIDMVTIPTLGTAIDFGNTLDPIKGQGCTGSRTRLAMFGGVSPGGDQDNVTYVTFASLGDATDTGDLVTACKNSGFGNQIRGIIAGATPYTNTMEYTTIATLGDTKDYGDLTVVRGFVYTCASTTRGLIAGGINNPSAPAINTIDYVTIQTTGNSSDFGDMIGTTNYEGTGFSNATRGVFAAGYRDSYSNTIQYVTIATTGNAVDFGDLVSLNGTGKYSASSPTRGVIAGGTFTPTAPYTNTIEYITIASTGNSAEFGDMTNAVRSLGDCGGSNGHGGL